MRLVDVCIKGFRSIDNVGIPEIGSLNVLIGKNNSGKSTILSSIDTFFRCIRGANIIALDPPIGRVIDFHRQLVSHPLEIGLVFLLQPEEGEKLQAEIAKAAPQLRAAAGPLNSESFLRATLAINADPNRFAYVKTLELIIKKEPQPEVRLLMRISPDVAIELATRQRASKSAKEIAETLSRFLQNFDEDDFRRVKSSENEMRGFARYNYLNRRHLGDNPAEVLPITEALLKASNTHAEFISNTSDYRRQLLEDTSTADSAPTKNVIETFSGEQNSIPSYAINLVQQMSAIKILYLTERRDPVGRAEATQLLRYKVTRGGTETLKEIQQTISNLLGVQVDAFESTQTGNPERQAEMDVDNFLLEVNGSGIKEALRLLLDVELKKPAILLVEEPEVHLHPALEINMMRYLRKKSEACQVFLSTHSTNFLDSFEMKNVYFISKPETKTEVQLLNIADAEAKIPKELGIRLSSLFMFDRIAFVEGPTDEAVFRELASTLDINLSHSNVGFIHLGGVRNFAYYATQSVFSFLTKRQVKLWFILDRDERDDGDLAKMNELLGEKAIMKFLNKRELENYLLQPRAVTEFIRWKQTNQPTNKAEVNEMLVKNAIDDAAEQLKGLAIAKRAYKAISTPLRSSIEWSAIETAESALEKVMAELEAFREKLLATQEITKKSFDAAKKNIEHDWNHSKVNLVPGDLLLDLVCRQFGTRFKKETDSAKLAALLSPNEVAPDLGSILKELVR